MAPLNISFLIRAMYDLLPSIANLVRLGMKDDPTCQLCQGKHTTDHILSSCKAALSQGRYTWRHKKVFQELAIAICDAKTRTLVFSSEGGIKSSCGIAASMDTKGRAYWIGVLTWIFSRCRRKEQTS
ncbi:polyprotein [Plakobranchus ocellatus]|uniref:Polyprotein n=1 Tax=Plakobranchus ocellatus TaxID=259542 RepID=A0AAV3ZIK3_9GAST|nr:polyprotein [Plakobranchus ocellatus]